MSSSNTSFNKPSGNEDIDKEVANIFKKNKQRSSYQLMEELRHKYKDEEIVDSIMKKYFDKMKRVRKLAEKIRERLMAKHPNLSKQAYIQKITEYKKKYDFDDSEMQVIINLIFMDKSALTGPELWEPAVTEMGKSLGFMPSSYHMAAKAKVSRDDLDSFNTIRTLAATYKELHSQVTLQSIVYTDCSNMAQLQKVDRSKVNIFSFVHPVVAALFLPKFKLLDEHMLLASIATIVDIRAEGFELRTQPEYELYWDIATDPSENACSITKTKPFHDLLLRVNIQIKLWESVLSLRQGKFYHNDLTSFILAIDQCKASIFDAADLAYVKDEGTILRKLFAAFSLRPTIILAMPVYGISQSVSNVPTLATSHITTVPMITFRIPLNIVGKATRTINLQDALSQRQIFIHHKQLMVKTTQVLYSREILVFYVHRRFQTLNWSRLTRPYEIATLPITMSQFERIQEEPIDFDMNIKTSSQEFNLKSVVAVETAQTSAGGSSKMIIGCSALVVCGMDCPDGTRSPIAQAIQSATPEAQAYALQYKPLDMNNCVPTAEEYQSVNPISGLGVPDLVAIARTHGTIFIYKVSKFIDDNMWGFQNTNC